MIVIFRKFLNDFTICFKWLIISLITGSITGLVGSALYICLSSVTGFRESHTYMKYFLPIGGIVIVFVNKFFKESSKGPNLVIDTIHSTKSLTPLMAPAMFISTIITHLTGGSAGREGAAIQIGGSLGYNIGIFFKLEAKDRNIITMCGISAAFSALLGTPIAATIFAIEVASIGIMHYSALLPCSISAIVALETSKYCNIKHRTFSIMSIPSISPSILIKLIISGCIFALISILFCFILHKTHEVMEDKIKNDYFRIIIGGITIILLSILLNTNEYLGAGIPIIEKSLKGEAFFSAFILKIIFTAITLGAGFKGGEIVPSFFIGATLGCVLGRILGISPSFCAALGMISLFCGVTNCPMTSLIISFELFSFKAVPFFLISIGISYMISGYSGLYKSQKIMYSKVTAQFIDRKVL